MVSGNTVDRIAQNSKVSPETVRAHVRRAYSKMSVSSREEMFSRITPFLFGRKKI
jgi:DNA-binding CsgD family transcriptional regulator